MPASFGMVALVLVIVKIFDLNLETDDGDAGSLAMVLQVNGQQIG